MTGLYRSLGSVTRRLGALPTYGGLSEEDPLVDVAGVTTQALPGTGEWDDGTGTVYLEDGNGNKRAVSWSPSGFTVVENGVTLEKYPLIWNDPPHTPATTYYVDATGGDNGAAGTSEGTAWQTIAKVNGETFSAGDQILFRRGRTWNETLTISWSGSESNVIKFGAYGPENEAKPIIDAELTRDYTIVATDKSNLWLDNVHSKRGKEKNSETWDERGDVTFFNPTDVTVTNCYFSLSGQTALTGARNANNFRVKDCYFFDNVANGLGLRSALGTHDARGFVLTDCLFERNGTVYINGGVQFAGNVDTGHCYNNTFINQTGPNFTLYPGWGVKASNTGNFRIHDNILDNNAKAFSVTCIKGQGAKTYRNKIYNSSHSASWHSVVEISQAYPNTNEARLHHNTMFLSPSGVSQAGTRAKSSTGAIDARIWNNTVYDVDIGMKTSEPASPPGADEYSHFRFLNNIVSNSANYNFQINTEHGYEEADYNYYYTTAGTFATYRGSSKNFDQWKALGFDTNSVNGASPQFVDPTNATLADRNYGIPSSSPARSKGTDVVYDMTDPNSWIGINYVPHATSPDCGAYQYLSGKTLEFAKWFLGLKCNGGTAQRLKLWSASKDEATLQTMTT